MKSLPLVITCSILFTLSCSLIDPNDPISWHAKYSLPFVKNKITTKNLLFENPELLSVFNDDSLAIGDTLTVSLSDSMIEKYSTILFYLDDLSLAENLGSFKVGTLPPVSFQFTISDSGFPPVPLPYDFPITRENATHISQFEYVRFDRISEDIIVEYENLSKSITLKNISTTLQQSGTVALTIDTIPQLLPQQIKRLNISLAGKTIESNLVSIIAAELGQGSLITSGNLLRICLYIKNQYIEEAVIDESVVNYQFQSSFDVPLNQDTFNCDYFDIEDMHIPLTFINETPLAVEITPVLGNALDQEYAVQENIFSYDDLSNTTIDSTYFLGNTIPTLLIEGSSNPLIPKISHLTLTLGNARILPEWHTLYQHSKIPIQIEGRIFAQGKKVRIHKDMSLGLKLKNPQIFFTELRGSYGKDKLVYGTPALMVSPFTGASDILKELRDKFKLIRSEFRFTCDFLIEDDTYISQLNYDCLFFPITGVNPNIDTIHWEMKDIKKGSPKIFQMNPDKIVNSFPDSLVYLVNNTFPKNKSMFFGKKVLTNLPNQSSIDIKVKTTMELILYMAWEVSDTINIDLKDTRSPLLFNPGLLDILQDMSLSLEYSLFNQTNINARIFAYGATTKHSKQLYDLDFSELGPALLNTPTGEHIIPVLGDSGIFLPPRNYTNVNTITLSQDHMNDILDTDSLFIRWGLTLFPIPADALTDTDYVSLDAIFHLEGTQSTDILPGNIQ